MNGNGSVVERLTRSTAEMTPHERSAQADEMRRTLVELAAAHNRLVALVDKQGAAIIEQRAALDEQGIVLASRCQERWDAASETHKRIGDRHQAFVSRSFTARLRWLFRGR